MGSPLTCLVETRGVEPLSENLFTGLSTSVFGLIFSPLVVLPTNLREGSAFIRGCYKHELTSSRSLLNDARAETAVLLGRTGGTFVRGLPLGSY